MSRLTELIAQARNKDAQLGADLEREFRVLSSRLPFGLNFERHRPEAVELRQRPVRKGDKVRVLDLTREDVRKAIAHARHAAEPYRSGFASDYL
jgi:adenine-specific DNA-methyltransferase